MKYKVQEASAMDCEKLLAVHLNCAELFNQYGNTLLAEITSLKNEIEQLNAALHWKSIELEKLEKKKKK